MSDQRDYGDEMPEHAPGGEAMRPNTGIRGDLPMPLDRPVGGGYRPDGFHLEIHDHSAEALANGLSEAQRRDIIALGDPKNPFGGLFDALSATDLAALKAAGLVRCYIPEGCLAPLTKLTPKGKRLRAILQENQP